MGAQIFKTYEAADLQVNEGKREVISIINTDAVDRDSEVVQPKGMKRKNFAGNPVVFTNHDYRSLPVGKSLWIKESDNKLIAKTYVSDQTQLARDVFGLMQDGILNAFSIGFNSLRSSAPTTAEINKRPDLKGVKTIHREWELLEYSIVGIPANPEAVTLAVSKGYSPEVIDIISGKAMNTVEATKAVVAAVESDPAMQKSSPSEKEIRERIAKEIERITVAIDPDRIVAAALKKLA